MPVLTPLDASDCLRAETPRAAEAAWAFAT